MIQRQPFPGPGLAIRVIGEVTASRLETLREADWIVLDEIKAAGLYGELWQSFAILTPIDTVGVMGDGRTYANVVAVRAVTSDDGMTADWARLPYDLLARISAADRERGARREPGRVRHQLQAARPPSSGSDRSAVGCAGPMSSWFDKLLEEMQRRQIGAGLRPRGPSAAAASAGRAARGADSRR